MTMIAKKLSRSLITWKRTLSLLAIDLFLAIISIFISYFLRLESWSFFLQYDSLIAIKINIFLFIPLFFIFGIYNNLLRFIDINYLLNLIYACSILTIIFFILVFFFDLNIPRSIPLINGIIFWCITSFVRLLIFLSLNQRIKNNDQTKNIILFGAGNAGFNLLTSSKDYQNIDVKAIIDDDNNKHYKSLNGIKIFPREDIEELINYYEITSIIVAVANISNLKKLEIINFLNKFNVMIKFLPNINDILNQEPSMIDLKDLKINDLVMRDISINRDEIKRNIYKKKILITGGGGSIGERLSIECLQFEPQDIIILDHSEFNLYKIENLLNEIILDRKINTRVISILASIKDKKRIDKVFEKYKPDIVYHSAAYKHVSIVHNNIIESVTNNILGTLSIVECALKYHTPRFLLVSTDKAVRPTNIMGASKRFAELIIQAKSNLSGKINTNFSIVRFGNVLGSSGSVVPKFTEQIKKGGPVTVRDKNVTRYFMSIEEAVRLILEADSKSKGGEVFVLNMGNPIKIIDLAEKMINLAGYKVSEGEDDNYDSIKIIITGLNKSEKLYEELLIGNNPTPTSNPDIMKANEEFIEWNKLSKIIDRLNICSSNLDDEGIIEILKETTYLEI